MANGEIILVVDDDPWVTRVLRQGLEERGYSILEAADGMGALEGFFSQRPDLMLLDLVIPFVDGLEVIRQVRQLSPVPIIVLSGLGEERERVQALQLGADDYLTKPVALNELVARVEATLRRASWARLGPCPEVYRDPELTLDPTSHRVFVRGQEVFLTPLEFRLLQVLVAHADRTLPLATLVRQVWGPGPQSPRVRQRVIWHMVRLRRKIEEDPRRPKRIIGVWGVGYRYQRPQPT